VTHPTPNAQWQAVFEEMEAGITRAQSALDDNLETAVAVANLVTPGPMLPPIDTMPPVPSELRNRISALRERITEVRRELEAAIAETERKLAEISEFRPRLHLVHTQTAPVYLDRVM
jgi:hypothetical protein